MSNNFIIYKFLVVWRTNLSHEWREIDFLSTVFFEELQISNENTPQNAKVIFLNFEPSTADDKTKQFVFVKLKVVIPTDYSTVATIWSAVNSRGLSDELLDNLLTEARLISECKDLKSQPVPPGSI